MAYKKYWRIALVVLIIGTMAFGTAFGATTEPDCTGPKVGAVETDHSQGNPPTPEPPAGGYSLKVGPDNGGPWTSGQIDFEMGDVDYTVYYEIYDGGKLLKFWTEDDYPIVSQVVVKGGDSANIYTYATGVYNDCNLVSPDMTQGDMTTPGISHVDFVFAPPTSNGDNGVNGDNGNGVNGVNGVNGELIVSPTPPEATPSENGETGDNGENGVNGELIVSPTPPEVTPSEEEITVTPVALELPRTGGYEMLLMGMGGLLAGTGAYIKIRNRKKRS